MGKKLLFVAERYTHANEKDDIKIALKCNLKYDL